MSDVPYIPIPDPRGKCDYICMLDGEHVERGEIHQLCYELPSPRSYKERYDALQAKVSEVVEYAESNHDLDGRQEVLTKIAAILSDTSTEGEGT